NLSAKEMAQLGLRLGSDIPFFFSGGQALVTGRGEVVTETELPTDYWLVLITPNIFVSTAESYAALKIGLTRERNPVNLKRCQTVDEFVESLKLSANSFEEVHFLSYPELVGIKNELLKRNALLARMSGSGATMFGIFKEVAEEWTNKRTINQGDWRVNVVRPITLPLKNMGKGGSGGDY
ncbi:MAG: 4-(cytidine 5'-diphospho)-2-C-methyl-D-erythritol kinase, partial [Candidatus Zixiibacteriota bacterium]